MTAALLILANIIIYCIQRFWIKNMLGKRLMSIGTILTFISDNESVDTPAAHFEGCQLWETKRYDGYAYRVY